MNRIKKYNQYIKESVDKYQLFDEIKEIFYHITDEFDEFTGTYLSYMGEGQYKLYINDTNDNKYADDSFNFVLKLNKDNNLPKMYSNDTKCLTTFYDDMSTAIDRIKTLDGVKTVSFYYANDGRYHKIEVSINSIHDPESQMQFEDYLKNEGFQVGSTYIALEVDDYIFRCRKPTLLKNTFNKENIEINSQSHDVDILDKNWKEIGGFKIDERYTPAVIYPSNYDSNINITEPLHTLINDKFKQRSKSERESYQSPIKYAQDLFLWFRDNI